jgi:hypothetical protein
VLYHAAKFFRTKAMMMSATAQSHERIDLRTSPEIKELIVRAASTAGLSVSDHPGLECLCEGIGQYR